MAQQIIAPQANPPAGSSSLNSPAGYTRVDYGLALREWEQIEDCLLGQRRIKERARAYLPPPEPLPPGLVDTNDERWLRYLDYITRAVFYNVTQWTANGLVGEVFESDPEIDVPPQLEALVKDADGTGTSLIQLSKATLLQVLAKGRAGLFVDFPSTAGQVVTIQDVEDRHIRPNIVSYKPENVINWRVSKVGNKWVYNLVVLKEVYDAPTGRFESRPGIRFRVLFLNDAGNYCQQIYQDIETRTDNIEGPVLQMFDTDGQPIKEIPFMFVGSVDNGYKINPMPMLAISDLNIAHYRNSADYEEAVFRLGQPTAVATGLTKQWVEQVLKGKIRLGARGGVPLPAGATFDIVQVEPNTMAKEAMDAKEDQMQALGAKLIESRDVEATATEIVKNAAAQQSILGSCAGNTSAAFKWCLEWAAIFAGATSFKTDAASTNNLCVFKLPTEFDTSRMPWQDRQQLMKEWQANGITTSEYRSNLKRGGIALLDDQAFRTEQAADIAADLQHNAELIRMQAAAGGITGNKQPGVPVGGK